MYTSGSFSSFTGLPDRVQARRLAQSLGSSYRCRRCSPVCGHEGIIETSCGGVHFVVRCSCSQVVPVKSATQRRDEKKRETQRVACSTFTEYVMWRKAGRHRLKQRHSMSWGRTRRFTYSRKMRGRTFCANGPRLDMGGLLDAGEPETESVAAGKTSTDG